jgi:hypothetical protein
MNNDELRQIVRIRHELRRLLPTPDGDADRDTVKQLLARMQALAAPHATEHDRIAPEVTRWQARFQLGM